MSGGATIGELVQQGQIAPGGTQVLCPRRRWRGGTRRAAKPDIGSVDAFKRALLEAKSIVYTTRR